MIVNMSIKVTISGELDVRMLRFRKEYSPYSTNF